MLKHAAGISEGESDWLPIFDQEIKAINNLVTIFDRDRQVRPLQSPAGPPLSPLHPPSLHRFSVSFSRRFATHCPRARPAPASLKGRGNNTFWQTEAWREKLMSKGPPGPARGLSTNSLARFHVAALAPFLFVPHLHLKTG